MKSLFQLAAVRGVTLVESMLALSVGAIGLGGLMAVNTHQLHMLRSTHESTAGSLCLQERVEQMRIANWRQLTSESYLRTTFFAAKPKTGETLESLTEKITVSAYPDASGTTPLVVTRSASGTPRTESDGTGLSAKMLARVDLTMQWKGEDGRLRERQSSLLLSNGGVSRVNLPAFGSIASGTTGGTTPTTTTITQTATPTGTTATPTGTATTTTTTSGSNGNGNGRGNVGGQSGKK